MPFYTTKRFNSERRKDHQRFYCPSGHNNYYPQQSDEEKLKEELAGMQRLKDHYRSEAERERQNRERAQRRASALKGQVTKANNKLKKGICPCCDEQFPDLEKHIKSQHPEFDIDQSGTKDPEFAAPKPAPVATKRGRPKKKVEAKAG
jgi:hypothetical protein